VWQAGRDTGMQIANEPGAPAWNEVFSRDFEKAKEFYAAVFGYTYDDMSSDEFQYAVIQVDGRGVGGIGGMPPGMPDSVPSHWRVYFEVDDADETVDMVVKQGGVVRQPPEDTPYGRMASLADPQGAPFSIIRSQHPGG
jgi:predicted enzyme related to lactoylglutathione lyase